MVKYSFFVCSQRVLNVGLLISMQWNPWEFYHYEV